MMLFLVIFFLFVTVTDAIVMLLMLRSYFYRCPCLYFLLHSKHYLFQMVMVVIVIMVTIVEMVMVDVMVVSVVVSDASRYSEITFIVSYFYLTHYI